MSDDLVKRLHDRRVCSPAQNSCRNDHVLNQAASRIEELEAKLAKAVEAMEVCVNNQPTGLYADHSPFYWTLRTTLAELKGQNQ